MTEYLRRYMRLVENRSREHDEAFTTLYAKRLFGACAGIIRQEIDNLMRVDYLTFGVPLSDRDELCQKTFSGVRWTKTTRNGKYKAILDSDFREFAAKNHSWVSLAYDYSSKFIHLTNFWDYEHSDPIATMDEADKCSMKRYLEEYHDFGETTLTMDYIIEFLPMVFEKIRSNVESYISEEEGLLLICP